MLVQILYGVATAALLAVGLTALRVAWDFARNGHQALDLPEAEHSGPMRYKLPDGGERVSLLTVPSDDAVDSYTRR